MLSPDTQSTATLKLSDSPSADEYAAAFANMRKDGTYQPSKGGGGGNSDAARAKRDKVSNYTDVSKAVEAVRNQRKVIEQGYYNPDYPFKDVEETSRAKRQLKRLIQKLRDRIAGREDDGATGGAELLASLSIKEFDDEATLTVTKQANGAHRWIAISSSAYRDRDGEIVSTKALEDDVARADTDGDYGPLRWWHVKGLDIGRCDYNAMHGRLLVESGTFDDPRIAEAIKAHADELAVSIGFNHALSEPDSEGVFHTIRRFERSFLPQDKASNPFTAVGAVMKESSMTQEKTNALEKLVGDPEVVSGLIAHADTTQKAADDAAVAFKEAAKPEDDAEEADEETEGEDAEDKPEEGMPKAQKKAARTKAATVGNMTEAAFAAAIGAALHAAFAPVLAATKEVKPADPSVLKLLQGMDARLKELEGDAPTAFKAHGVAGESGDVTAAIMAAAGMTDDTTKEQTPQAGGELFKLLFPHIK